MPVGLATRQTTTEMQSCISREAIADEPDALIAHSKVMLMRLERQDVESRVTESS